MIFEFFLMTTEFAEFGIILIENFLLRVLSASAVIFFG